MQPNIQWKFNFGETIILLILDMFIVYVTCRYVVVEFIVSFQFSEILASYNVCIKCSVRFVSKILLLVKENIDLRESKIAHFLAHYMPRNYVAKL